VGRMGKSKILSKTLCVFFNYPYPANIEVWDKLYSSVFDQIIYVQPFIKSDMNNVYTVYRAAFNFGGYFSDISHILDEIDTDVIIFCGDDCLINPDMFSSEFEDTFTGFDRKSVFLPQFLNYGNEGWFNNPHKRNTLGRFINGYGAYDQRVEGWRSYLPEDNYLLNNLKKLGFSTDLNRPSNEFYKTLSPTHQEIINITFQKQDRVQLPYPLVYGVSDFFMIGKDLVSDFCSNVGAFASLNVFPEVAVPTALLTLDANIIQANSLNLKYRWTYGRNDKVSHFVPTNIDEIKREMSSMESNELFIHPVKMSKVKLYD
jgi:hypothetical protein